MDGKSRLRPHIPALILLGTLALSLIAIARPVALVTTPAHERTIMLAIDVSMSMAAEDMKPSRLGAAQAAAKAFITSLPADVHIGVVAFAGHAHLVQRPTLDRLQASAVIDRLEFDHYTAIGSGLLASLIALFPDERFAENYDVFGSGVYPNSIDPLQLVRNHAPPRLPLDNMAVAPGDFPSAAIVLLTDGADTAGVPGDMAARFAAERGVRVYTVGFGKPGTRQTLGDQTTDAGFDETVLKRIAQRTHGAYFPAATAQELDGVYRRLPGRIVLRKTGMELAAFFAAAAAILAMLAGGLSLAWSGPIVVRER